MNGAPAATLNARGSIDGTEAHNVNGNSLIRNQITFTFRRRLLPRPCGCPFLTLTLSRRVSSWAGGAYLIRGPVVQAGSVQWAATGGGLLVTGSGRDLSIAIEEAPSHTLARIKLGLPASGAALYGRYAYVALDGAGIEAMDLSSPTKPFDLGLVPSGAAAQSCRPGG